MTATSQRSTKNCCSVSPSSMLLSKTEESSELLDGIFSTPSCKRNSLAVRCSCKTSWTSMTKCHSKYLTFLELKLTMVEELQMTRISDLSTTFCKDSSRRVSLMTDSNSLIVEFINLSLQDLKRITSHISINFHSTQHQKHSVSTVMPRLSQTRMLLESWLKTFFLLKLELHLGVEWAEKSKLLRSLWESRRRPQKSLTTTTLLRSIQPATMSRWTLCLLKKLSDITDFLRSWRLCLRTFKRPLRDKSWWVKILRLWLHLSSITRFQLLGQRLASFLLSHWHRGTTTCLIELISWRSGLRVELQLLSGFQDSSSHKLSSLLLFRTMPESTSLPLINLTLSLRFMTKLLTTRLLSPQKMESLPTVCILKVLDGTTLLTSWMTLSQSSSTQSFQCFGSFPKRTENNQILVSTCAQSTRSWAEQEPCPPLVTPPTSSCTWSCHLSSPKTSGSLLE